MLDEFIREYEAKWLDEHIPALDGHTPRQAVDDPTRRGDLIKLLDSFPADEGTRAHERSVAALRTRPGRRVTVHHPQVWLFRLFQSSARA